MVPRRGLLVVRGVDVYVGSEIAVVDCGVVQPGGMMAGLLCW